jgi:ABC-type bacteriocin/lantibiotic exporter with double-glycine peptidase domain
VGFIGSNGTGKTTLLDVVSGLLVPQRGRVEIDGVTLDAQNRSAWLTCLAYVPQRAYLCDRTFAENIALGVRNGAIDHDLLRKVVSLAGLDACVASLPRGYDERLGEHGGRLSGGQRQRLAIARALYRNAPVLLLDESTSSLDLSAESDITDMLHAERRDRTTLIVAHRLSALRHCDVIHELARGGIVRSGSFDQVNEWIVASSAAESPQSALPLSQNHQEVIAHITE